MKIKFHDIVYNLIGEPNVMSTHFQAMIEKGDNTFDAIAEDTLTPDDIILYNDEDEVSGVYTGFTKRVALYVLEGNNSVSVEFENDYIQSRIDALTSQLNNQETAIADLGEMVSSESETNDVQDSAISELADAISVITPEEG